MRTFEVLREADWSEPSGDGIAEGVVFEDGLCVVRWCTTAPNSVVLFPSLAYFLQMLCSSHPGSKTTVRYRYPGDRGVVHPSCRM